MKKSKKSTTNPVIGQRVRVTEKHNSVWCGIYHVVEVYDSGTIKVNHSTMGPGAFYLDEYEVIPLTKLERALQ